MEAINSMNDWINGHSKLNCSFGIKWCSGKFKERFLQKEYPLTYIQIRE